MFRSGLGDRAVKGIVVVVEVYDLCKPLVGPCVELVVLESRK